ncbi:MAG: asparagine synthase (glutamine-hydrolyzing), partial [Candidatus Aenigmarchaeota archaeon]|nr:asparagine synthase (glutamine-hydrolyzing) [Candidatus Aenigmarchaeota archaeon]
WMGIKPLYYYFKDGKFIFASEMKAILDADIKKETDKNILDKYLMLRYTPGTKTIVKNVSKLKPAHYLVFNPVSKKMNISFFWNPKYQESEKNKDYLAKELYSVMKRNVESHTISDVPVGVYLSGGLDSSIITALMREQTDNVKTFSIGFNEEEHSELKYARKISECLDTEHKEYIVDSSSFKILDELVYAMDEPFGDTASIPNYILSQKAKKEVTVVLTGEGADEVFGGYEQYKFLELGKTFTKIPMIARKSMAKCADIMPDSILNSIFPYTSQLGAEGINRFKNYFLSNNPQEQYMNIVSIFSKDELIEFTNMNNKNTNLDDIDTLSDNSNNYNLNQVLELERKTSLPENLLMKVERTTMAHSIEARVPFLSNEVVEFANNLPCEFKLHNFTGKYILREAFKKDLPSEIISRKKHRFFVPIDSWIENDLKESVSFYIDEIKESPHFNGKYLDRLESNFKKSPLYYSRQLWNLICFKKWEDVFLK